jgi:hypothetical protein
MGKRLFNRQPKNRHNDLKCFDRDCDEVHIRGKRRKSNLVYTFDDFYHRYDRSWKSLYKKSKQYDDAKPKARFDEIKQRFCKPGETAVDKLKEWL